MQWGKVGLNQCIRLTYTFSWCTTAGRFSHELGTNVLLDSNIDLRALRMDRGMQHTPFDIVSRDYHQRYDG